MNRCKKCLNKNNCGLKEKYPKGIDSNGNICWLYERPLGKLKGKFDEV